MFFLLDEYHNKHPLLFNKTLIADAVYNMKKLKNKVDKLKLGKLLLTHTKYT